MKYNIIFLQKTINCTKGLLVNYSFASICVIVFGQISDCALTAYGVVFPYLMVGIAITEGMEMAVFYTLSKNAAQPVAALVLVQFGIAVLYSAVGFLLPRSSLIDGNEWDTVCRPLICCYSVFICTAVFSGMLRARGSMRKIYYATLTSSVALIASAIVQLSRGTLTNSSWSLSIMAAAIIELSVFLVLALNAKWCWRLSESRVDILYGYLSLAAPVAVGWLVVAADRFWLNCILSYWNAKYIAVINAWYQFKPLLILPAVALAQVLIRHRHERANDHAGRPNVFPAMFLYCSLYVVFLIYIFKNIYPLMMSIAPLVDDVMEDVRSFLLFDSAVLPAMAAVSFSKLFLELEKKGWVICILFASAMFASKIFMMLLGAFSASIDVFVGSAVIQISILFFIPVYLMLMRRDAIALCA